MIITLLNTYVSYQSQMYICGGLAIIMSLYFLKQCVCSAYFINGLMMCIFVITSVYGSYLYFYDLGVQYLLSFYTGSDHSYFYDGDQIVIFNLLTSIVHMHFQHYVTDFFISTLLQLPASAKESVCLRLISYETQTDLFSKPFIYIAKATLGCAPNTLYIDSG